MLKCWHASDTHGYHDQLQIPEGIDMVIHTGDCSNYRDPIKNEKEVRDFIDWFSNLDIKYKIYVAGNHDTSIELRLVSKYDFEEAGIIYLENNSVEIEGIKIWGSPVTPMFHNWSFMMNRDVIYKAWVNIPEDTDIIAVHGPPKGILDLGYDHQKQCIEYCGCSELLKVCLEINPKYVLFGHIHNGKNILNCGQLKLAESRTIYSNATAVVDGKFTNGIINHGFVFDI